jgi:hypothetical protein
MRQRCILEGKWEAIPLYEYDEIWDRGWLLWVREGIRTKFRGEGPNKAIRKDPEAG